MASQPYLGAIFLFAGNFAPRGFMLCQGQTLPISQYAALFSILGTTYGGNGTSTFQLPNLVARAAVGAGNAGGGLPAVVQGQIGGAQSATILTSNLPPHSHTVALTASNAAATLGVPTPTTVLAAPQDGSFNPIPIYNPGPGNVTMAPINSGNTGSAIPISTQSPFLGLTYIIATEGLFPSRN